MAPNGLLSWNTDTRASVHGIYNGDDHMLIRPLALALLIGATQAHAAPKKHKPAPPPEAAAATAPENIDVDAMARAKDAGTSDAAAPTATPPAAGAAADTTATAVATPPAADIATPKDAPAASAPADVAPATNTVEKKAVTGGAPPLLTPAPDASEQRLAAACEARATSLLDAAQKGDYAAATKDFDAKMRTGLPPQKFKQAWESLAQFGSLTARGQSHPALGEGYIAVTIPLLFEKANLYAQVACGSDGRVAGFYVKPLAAPNP
jgi:hypothetical protein